MNNIFGKTIKYTFYLLIFATPLVFYPYTSELFEFNKVVLVYLATIVIIAAWIAQMTLQQKFIFSRTILDIPLLIFLCSQLISTIISIDRHTSIFGYYGRFNGGLISLACYSLLYWAFISNIKRLEVKKLLYLLLASALLVSIYAFFEHYGKSFSCLLVTGKFDVACWVQDVQNRVFATLGQPNWLAAWIVAIIPFTWSFGIDFIKSKYKFTNFLFPFLSGFFFTILLFTKSRSGILGFTFAFVFFWSYAMWKDRKIFKKFIITSILIFVISLLVGTPWTPKISDLFNKPKTIDEEKTLGPALETGGTESGEIRKIVWKGTVDVWKNYPVFGSGVETFAYSYNQFRPAEHNLTSEWDYIYNKAHNEYLNFAATTGTLGILSYVSLIIFILFVIFKNINKEDSFMSLAILSGFLSLLVSNFFGFSVVSVSLLFFLYPALSYSNQQVDERIKSIDKLKVKQKLMISAALLIGVYFLNLITKYWYADFLFAKSQNLSRANNFSESINLLKKAIQISPNQAVYLNELATLTASTTLSYHEAGYAIEAKNTAKIFEDEIERSLDLSPRNLNIKRSAASLYTRLSAIDTKFLVKANSILQESEKLAPIDPKIKLNLAGSYIRLGNKQAAESLLNQVISLKPNYKEGRYALAAILADRGEKEMAIQHLNYVLEKVDPTDKNFKQLIEDIKKQ